MRCNLCPRHCNAIRRLESKGGACASELLPRVARAALHFGEEPCISGTTGSGTVFFSGCSLGCVYCQNRTISHEHFGKLIEIKRLSEIISELCDSGVHNINLVTPTHFSSSIVSALKLSPPKIPVVWNSSGYELTEQLEQLNGLVKIYMPDLKYSTNLLAHRYSNVSDYTDIAQTAILEMFRQCGAYRLDEFGIMQSGVIIRHMILPNNLENSYGVIDWVKQHFDEGDIMFSLMAQYTPIGDLKNYPELQRPITEHEYNSVEEYLYNSGIIDGYIQDLQATGTDLIPNFDLTGL